MAPSAQLTTSPEHDSDSLLIEFDPGTCPECGISGIPGECHCGSSIVASKSQTKATRARKRALEPFLDRVNEIVAGYERITPGTIEVDVGQFLRTIGSVGWFGRAEAVVKWIDRLKQLDLNDPKVIGGPVRKSCARMVRTLESLAIARDELSRFKLLGEGDALRLSAIEIGRHASVVVRSMLETLTAADYSTAMKSGAQFEKALSSLEALDQFSEQLSSFSEGAHASVSDRANRVAAEPGSYESDFGGIDLSRLIASYSGLEDPYDRLGVAVAGFFSSIVGTTVKSDSVFVLLAGNMAAMSVLDDPFPAHLATREVFGVAAAAFDVDQCSAERCCEPLVGRANLILGSRARLERQFSRLSTENVEDQSDEAFAELLLDVIHDMSESTWRFQAQLLLDLIEISSSERFTHETERLSISNLEERLVASPNRFANRFAQATDSSIRNCFAHRSYEWNSETSEMVDIDSGVRWSIDDLEDCAEELNAMIIGFDAGLTLAMSERGIAISGVEFALTSRVPKVLVENLFALKGFDLVSVVDSGECIQLREFSERDVESLIPAAVGYGTLGSDLDVIRLTSLAEPGLEVVVSVANAPTSSEHSGELSGISIMRFGLETRRASSLDSAHQLETVGPAALKVALEEGAQLLNEGMSRDELSAVRSILSEARKLVSDYGDGNVAQLAITHIEKCERAATDAYLGSRGGLRTLVRSYDNAISWASQFKIDWC